MERERTMIAMARKKNAKRKSRAEAVIIEQDRCKGCGFCIAFCPSKVLDTSDIITLRGYHPPRVAELGACSACDFCRLICPEFAIYSVKAPKGERSNS